jgi:hypothetical protein
VDNERPSFFNDLPKVSAPADFEQAVLSRTVELKKRTQRRVITAALVGTLLGIATMSLWYSGEPELSSRPPFSALRSPVVVPRGPLSLDAPLAHTVNLYDLPPVKVAAASTPLTEPRTPRTANRVRHRTPVAGY